MAISQARSTSASALTRGEPNTQCAEAWDLRCHVEGEKPDGEHLEHRAEEGLPDAKNTARNVGAEAGEIATYLVGCIGESVTGEIDAES